MRLYLQLMPSLEEFYQIADELRAIATLGLQFAANEVRPRTIRTRDESERAPDCRDGKSFGR